MSEAESKPDPQLRIAEALEEIAIQLQRLNEGHIVVLSTEEADELVTEAAKKHGLPLPEDL